MTQSHPNLSRASILVVDDENHIRLMLRTILEAEGYRVAEANNGREALEIVRRAPFEAMVLDLNMPVLDGLGVLESLRLDPPRWPPRVVVLTAYGSIGAAVRATKAGALDFLEKPASPQEVREAVAAVLNEPQPARLKPVETDTEGGYQAVLQRVRKALRASDVAGAEALLMKAADLSQHDSAYFNLLGVIYETRRQWRLAKKFYGKAMRSSHSYSPAEQNMRRIYELYTFGRSRQSVALGDEPPAPPGALEELLRQRK
ncbi:MAG TPA: response regulator [Tepidisphaeraceae bacterium]|jgi:CheY-like chemotaxis protein